MKTINFTESSFYDNVKDPCYNEFITNEISNLFENKTCKFFKKNEILFSEESAPSGIYFLNSGKVKIFKTSGKRNEQILRFVTAGNFFGLISVITEEERITSATAIEDSYVCFIPKDQFLNMVNERSELSYYFMNCLSHVLKEVETTATNNKRPEKERLAVALISLCKQFESDTILCLKKDLVNFTNISRNRLTAYLHNLKEKKIIAFNSERIKILDSVALNKATNGSN